MTPKRRWWRVGGNHANKSGLHFFFRKPKLSQLLIPGRRSWWPDGKAPLVPLVSSPTNTECTSVSGIMSDDDNEERKSNKPNRKNTTKPKNKKGKKQHIFFSPTKELLIDEVPSEDCDAKQKRYRKKHQWKFWLPKEKRNMLTYDEDGSTRDDMHNMHTNNGVNKIKKKALSTRDITEKDEEDRKPGRNDKKKEYEKELKKRIVEAVTAASVSTIGVVVAIILL